MRSSNVRAARILAPGLHCFMSAGNEITDVFETRTATGRRMQALLVGSDLNRSVRKPLF